VPCPPDDLVQIATLDIRPVPNKVFKQFAAHYVVSRYGVLELNSRATALTARLALGAVLDHMPFPVEGNPDRRRQRVQPSSRRRVEIAVAEGIVSLGRVPSSVRSRISPRVTRVRGSACCSDSASSGSWSISAWKSVKQYTVYMRVLVWHDPGAGPT
jgi:hypothetical protein